MGASVTAGGAAQTMAGMAGNAFQRFRDASSPFSRGAGDVLFRQGDAPEGAYLIEQGRVSIATRSPGDEQLHMVEAGPGDLVGELALLDGARRSASAQAVGEVTGLFLPVHRFRALALDTDPGAFALVAHMRNVTVRRLRASWEAIAAAAPYRPALFGPVAGGPPPDDEGDAAQLLGGLGRLAELSAREAEAFAARAGRVVLARGETLSHQGARACGFHIVLRGALRLGVARDEGFEQVTVHGPGEMAGLVSFLDGAPQPLSIAASEPARLLCIETAAFDALADTFQDLAARLFDLINRQLVRDLRRANRHRARSGALARFDAEAAF